MTSTVLVIAIAIGLLLLGGWGTWYALGGRGSVASRRVAGAFGCAAFSAVLLGLLAVILPVFHGAREAAKNTPCFSNLNQIGKALVMYAGDNDERMPVSAWTDAIIGYVGDRSTYSCPVLNEPYGYSLNRQVIGLDTRIVYTARTVGAFDGSGGKDHFGDLSSVAFRHNDRYAVVGFLDGHCTRALKNHMPPLALQMRE